MPCAKHCQCQITRRFEKGTRNQFIAGIQLNQFISASIEGVKAKSASIKRSTPAATPTRGHLQGQPVAAVASCGQLWPLEHFCHKVKENPTSALLRTNAEKMCENNETSTMAADLASRLQSRMTLVFEIHVSCVCNRLYIYIFYSIQYTRVSSRQNPLDLSSCDYQFSLLGGHIPLQCFMHIYDKENLRQTPKWSSTILTATHIHQSDTRQNINNYMRSSPKYINDM